jgi:hypothetical protein
MGHQKWMWIVWPAFLSACVLELVVFALVDPQDLSWSGQPLSLSRQGVYTAAFFVFWAISMVCSALTTLLGTPPSQVNGCPVPPVDRPDGCAHR